MRLVGTTDLASVHQHLRLGKESFARKPCLRCRKGSCRSSSFADPNLAAAFYRLSPVLSVIAFAAFDYCLYCYCHFSCYFVTVVVADLRLIVAAVATVCYFRKEAYSHFDRGDWKTTCWTDCLDENDCSCFPQCCGQQID